MNVEFEEPAAPPAKTIHAQLADVVREVVRTDTAAMGELLKQGIVPSSETTALTSAMRLALLAYDNAALVAAQNPLFKLIVTAHAALEKGDADGVSAALSAALLLLDYDAAGPFRVETPEAVD